MHTPLEPDAALENSILVARDLLDRLAQTLAAAFPRPDSGRTTWAHVCLAQAINRRLAQALARAEQAQREE
jgi:hypothetical protein